MALQLHRNLMLPGPAGKIEAILWAVEEDAKSAPPPLAAVVCHPHPLYGGTMHNKVVYQTAKSMHLLGVPVLRFNFRGAGLSEGKHDQGRGEVQDVLAALDFLGSEYPGAPLLLAGFSFGAWVGLRVGCSDLRVKELIGLGLPVADLDARGLSYLENCDKPKLLSCGEFDKFSPPEKLHAIVNALPFRPRENTKVAIIAGGDHFFAGRLGELDRVIAVWLVERHPELVDRQSERL